MSVVIFFTVKGDSEELLAAYDKTVEVSNPSRLGHLMAPTKEGMTGVEVWGSQQDLERYLNEDLPGIFERAGVTEIIPPNASAEIAPVHYAHGRFAGKRARPRAGGPREQRSASSAPQPKEA